MRASNRFAVLVLSLLSALALTVLSGCVSTEVPPQLLNVLDFAPREAEVGDRLEVIGSGFPEGKTARGVFKGTLHRPGKEPVKGVEIDVEAPNSSSDKIEMMFTEGLQTSFCGSGDAAIHTTFIGNVIVSFPASTPGALPITGSVRGVQIDFRAPTARRAVIEAREKEGERALDFMGLTVANDSPAAGGLRVSGVRAASPADLAGVLPADLITNFESVRVLSKGDIAPSDGARFAVLSFRRGEAGSAEETRQINIEGFHASAPSDLLGAGLVLLVAAAIVLLFMAP